MYSDSERLQFFHRWLAVFMLILGLIHTFAFVYRNAQAGEGQMMWEMSASYWTGVFDTLPGCSELTAVQVSLRLSRRHG